MTTEKTQQLRDLGGAEGIEVTEVAYNVRKNTGGAVISAQVRVDAAGTITSVSGGTVVSGGTQLAQFNRFGARAQDLAVTFTCPEDSRADVLAQISGFMSAIAQDAPTAEEGGAA